MSMSEVSFVQRFVPPFSYQAWFIGLSKVRKFKKSMMLISNKEP